MVPVIRILGLSFTICVFSSPKVKSTAGRGDVPTANEKRVRFEFVDIIELDGTLEGRNARLMYTILLSPNTSCSLTHSLTYRRLYLSVEGKDARVT